MAAEFYTKKGVDDLLANVGPGGPGLKGDKGDKGDPGPQGVQGPPGPEGAQGPAGVRGPEGPTGQRGETGPQGAPGPAGAQGERGPKGDPGPAPDTSVFLTKALAGETYATKEALAKAQIGGNGQAPDLSAYLTTAKAAETYATKVEVQGIQSTPGPKGEKGDPGPAGAQGERGPAGEAGARGPAGEDGAAGLQGPRGEVGPQGPPGPAGERGPQGAPGAPGEPGEPGSPGAEGPPGPKGDPGPAGPAGAPADLSAYATIVELRGVQDEVKEAVKAASKASYPFENGGRYFSPVTYYWPDYYNVGQVGKTSKWAETLTMGNSLGIVIMNRHSGDWSAFDEDFKKQADMALAQGAKRVVFYVKTQYGAAGLPQGDPGRNNVPDVDKYTEDYILSMVRNAKTQYGATCQGVFLDEFINGHGDQAGRVAWYKSLVDKIRKEHGQDFLIVGNSGSNISDDVVGLDVDVFMMFEKDAKEFLKEDPGAPIFTQRMKQEPSTRWWIVVHGVSKDNYRDVFSKAESLPVSHLYLTDGVLVEDPDRGGQWAPVGNPYANPPSPQFRDLAYQWIKGTLGLALRVDALEKRPGGGASGFLVLGPDDPVPPGTPADTVIVRRQR